MIKSDFVVQLSDLSAKEESRFGPKSANQAHLSQAGVRTPGGFCLSAEAYRVQLEHLGLTEIANEAILLSFLDARQAISQLRIALFREPISPIIQDDLLSAYHQLSKDGAPLAVRSSSIMEDRANALFAGQFQSFLGIGKEADFLTAVRACWGALWSSRALRYMETKTISPNDAAMAVLVQPLIKAIASGGGMSQTSAGKNMTITATWGLGDTIAQGEIVPDLYELAANGQLIESVIGQNSHSIH